MQGQDVTLNATKSELAGKEYFLGRHLERQCWSKEGRKEDGSEKWENKLHLHFENITTTCF